MPDVDAIAMTYFTIICDNAFMSERTDNEDVDKILTQLYPHCVPCDICGIRNTNDVGTACRQCRRADAAGLHV